MSTNNRFAIREVCKSPLFGSNFQNSVLPVSFDPICSQKFIAGRGAHRETMPRYRIYRAPPGTLELFLNLTNRHIHAQLLDRKAGRVFLAVHTTEPVRGL